MKKPSSQVAQEFGKNPGSLVVVVSDPQGQGDQEEQVSHGEVLHEDLLSR